MGSLLGRTQGDREPVSFSVDLSELSDTAHGIFHSFKWMIGIGNFTSIGSPE